MNSLTYTNTHIIPTPHLPQKPSSLLPLDGATYSTHCKLSDILGGRKMIVLMKLCIVYLQFPVTSLLKGVQCSPTDITLIKCQQRAAHCARHRGGGRDESTSSTTCLSLHPQLHSDVSSLNAQLSTPGCCCLHVQLKHAVLPGMFSVFPRGTSESPLWAPFGPCAWFSLIVPALCHLGLHASPPTLVTTQTLISFDAGYSLLLLCDDVRHLSRYPTNVQNGWEIVLVFWELAILYWLWSQVQLFQQKCQSLLEGDPCLTWSPPAASPA